MRILPFFFVLACTFFALSCTTPSLNRPPTVMPLYPDSIPNSKPGPDQEKTSADANGHLIISKISRPTLTLFFPPKSKQGKPNGTAVIICPGGGYWVEAATHEGTDVAKKFTEIGVTAIVLKYRIPDDSTMVDRSIGALQDAQQAIKVVREHAVDWNINPARIGIMGFSAGGHLAATAGTHFITDYIPNAHHISLRPDFLLLIYPVITCQDSLAHKGSCAQILGKHPTQEQIDLFSNELQVTDHTPPTFLLQSSDDASVNPVNSILFYEALLKHHVPVEMHLYEKGGHGFGLFVKDKNELWMERCKNWLDTNGWLTSPKP
jgi:acetyl esterase/lipase